jgi:hypothetical protein
MYISKTKTTKIKDLKGDSFIVKIYPDGNIFLYEMAPYSSIFLLNKDEFNKIKENLILLKATKHFNLNGDITYTEAYYIK